MQEAHSAALREALIVVEELADVQPSFLHQLHTQLAETSPFMTIAAAAPSRSSYITRRARRS